MLATAFHRNRISSIVSVNNSMKKGWTSNIPHNISEYKICERMWFKACVRYFLSNFYLSPNDSPSEIMKNVFLFHQKTSVHSQDIQIFLFFSAPLFSPVSHCFRGWFKKNFKVCDVINCQIENLITHFVWYLEKEIRSDIELLHIDKVWNMEHFCGKIIQKIWTKASPRPLYNFAKWPKTAIACKKFFFK